MKIQKKVHVFFLLHKFSIWVSAVMDQETYFLFTDRVPVWPLSSLDQVISRSRDHLWRVKNYAIPQTINYTAVFIVFSPQKWETNDTQHSFYENLVQRHGWKPVTIFGKICFRFVYAKLSEMSGYLLCGNNFLVLFFLLSPVGSSIVKKQRWDVNVYIVLCRLFFIFVYFGSY